MFGIETTADMIIDAKKNQLIPRLLKIKCITLFVEICNSDNIVLVFSHIIHNQAYEQKKHIHKKRFQLGRVEPNIIPLNILFINP
jgi:hypothetical protein